MSRIGRSRFPLALQIIFDHTYHIYKLVKFDKDISSVPDMRYYLVHMQDCRVGEREIRAACKKAREYGVSFVEVMSKEPE